MNRYTKVRELVKDPSLRVTEIAWKTGYNKGHVSRLRKEFMRQELCRGEIMSENKQAKTPADGPDYERGFVDGMQRQMQLHVNRIIKEEPTAWRCQCGKPYTVTCISSKPSKQWVGLTDEQVEDEWERITQHSIYGGDRSEGRAMHISPNEVIEFSRAIEAKLREKNHG